MKQLLLITMQLTEVRDFNDTIEDTKDKVTEYIGQRSVVDRCKDYQYMMVEGISQEDIDAIKPKLPKCITIIILQTQKDFPKSQVWDIKE